MSEMAVKLSSASPVSSGEDEEDLELSKQQRGRRKRERGRICTGEKRTTRLRRDKTAVVW